MHWNIAALALRPAAALETSKSPEVRKLLLQFRSAR